MPELIDLESAKEFMKEALGNISSEELNQVCLDLEKKSKIFQEKLMQERIDQLEEQDLYNLLRHIFSTRRKASLILETYKFEILQNWISELLYSDTKIEDRFQQFYNRMDQSDTNVRFDLASELLHYTFPNSFWLWTRWIWDPKTKIGALPLVVTEDFDLEASNIGEAYLKIGKATAFLHHVGEAAGFEVIRSGPFGVDVYLSCVYIVYVYTVLRMRMTQEFNKVMPGLPEFSRRLLGVNELED